MIVDKRNFRKNANFHDTLEMVEFLLNVIVMI